LKDGKQTSRDVVITAKQYGISEITLRRAREELDIKTERKGFGKGSEVFWALSSTILDQPP